MKLLYALILITGIVLTLYYFIPVVRYYLIPITGGTKAPQSLLKKKEGIRTPQSAVQPGTILANDSDRVTTIDQVPEQGGWINSVPLDFADLYKQKKCILIDFWTYSCINCIRATPYTQELWDRYKDYGLVVIGVHSPEFEFEKKPSNILAAIEKAHITYPVWTDGNKKIWNEFGNHFWPGKYLIDPSNTIIYTQFGEGRYNEEERVVRQALKKNGWNPPDYSLRDREPSKKFLEPAFAKLRRSEETPELYGGLNFLRKAYGNKEQPKLNEVVDFDLPSSIVHDTLYLQGSWFGRPDYVESRSGSITLNYSASAPYIVLSPPASNESREVEVLFDGFPVPQEVQGEDIQVKDGKTVMTVDQPRLYYTIAHKTPYGRHTITLRVPPEVRFYSFAFGTY